MQVLGAVYPEYFLKLYSQEDEEAEKVEPADELAAVPISNELPEEPTSNELPEEPISNELPEERPTSGEVPPGNEISDDDRPPEGGNEPLDVPSDSERIDLERGGSVPAESEEEMEEMEREEERYSGDDDEEMVQTLVVL